MFSKLKQSLSDQGIDLEKVFAQIDFESLKEKSSETVRNVFQSIDEKTKSEIHNWIASVKQIKNDATLSESEKEIKIKDIKTSDTVLLFLKALIDATVNKVPIENKGLLKTGITGVGIAASILNIEFSGIALLILNKALPKFLLSSKFEEFSEFIEKQLSITTAPTQP